MYDPCIIKLLDALAETYVTIKYDFYVLEGKKCVSWHIDYPDINIVDCDNGDIKLYHNKKFLCNYHLTDNIEDYIKEFCDILEGAYGYETCTVTKLREIFIK